MAKDRDRALNPAAAQRKADKTRALKKSKAAIQIQRTEKLARRNPERLQRQIDELKAEQHAGSNGQLRPRDAQQLAQLERDVAAIRKARESTGVVAEQRPGRGGGGGRGGSSALGKRRRGTGGGGDDEEEEDGEQTDEDVRKIPMPSDTPPPIPRQQPRRGRMNANDVPLGQNDIVSKAPPPAQTTYSAAPQIRDLRKEATAKFVPAAVARQLKAVRGQGPIGRLLEPEEADKLEEAGYYDAKQAADAAGEEARFEELARDANGPGLEDEEERFRREMEELDENDVDAQREVLRASALEDGEQAAQAAVEEAEHGMMAEEHTAEGEVSAPKAENHLRHVEIEEVEDEDL